MPEGTIRQSVDMLLNLKSIANQLRGVSQYDSKLNYLYHNEALEALYHVLKSSHDCIDRIDQAISKMENKEVSA